MICRRNCYEWTSANFHSAPRWQQGPDFLDRRGQENQSIGQYRSLDRLKATGGQWDETDAGWWIFTDSSTQKKVTPNGWEPAKKDDNEGGEEE